jgi:hypothetical protein
MPLAAQQLRGTVRDSASRAPIPGAVLILFDSSGKTLERNITNDRGEYTLPLPAEARRVQVLRIGFRPQTNRVPAIVDGAARLDVVMPAIPTLLETVAIVEQPNCPRRDDGPVAFALWEQARAALLATVVSREANPPQIVRLQFVQRFDARDSLLGQVVHIDSASTSRPFIATRSAQDFVERGFSYDSARTKWFNGPDADVMLDDAFARGYCFSIAAADTARPKQIGLRFAAAKHKRGRTDIEGAVWIDSASRVLSDIVFRYVGADVAEYIAPGGRISFRTMDNGTVMIDRWALRTADYEQGLNPNSLRTRAYGRLVARESGGELVHARWPDGREWQSTLGRVRGTVTGTGLAGTEIRLVDTDYAAIVDSAGTFEISNLFPGPYVVGTIDVDLADADLVLMTHTSFTAVRDSTVTVSVDVPSAMDYAAALCRAGVGAPENAVLVARVVLPDGSPADAANVEVRAESDGNLRRIAAVETDRNGLVHLCQAPRNSRVQVRAQRRGADPVQLTVDLSARVQAVKLQLKPRPE